MARAQGARAQMALAFETVYGLAPAGGFRAAFESVKAIWVQLDDIVGHAAIQSTNALIAGVEAGIEG